VDKRATAGARAIAKTEAYAVSRRQRKKVEMLLAHLKRILWLELTRFGEPSSYPHSLMRGRRVVALEYLQVMQRDLHKALGDAE
jgi:hypothetical protein